MAQPPPEPEKESADPVAAEIGADGIEALPRRVQRYEGAKRRALDVAEYIRDQFRQGTPLAARLRFDDGRLADCGNYLTFRHYPSVDSVRLHRANLCMKHLLCPLCAIRRGAKALAAYLERWEVIEAEKTALRPFLVTLTVRDGDDLAERFSHLYRAQRELWMRKHRGRGSAFDSVEGAVWSYEVKRGRGSGQWHPHLHMIALAESMTVEGEGNPGPLTQEWRSITKDSFMVDVRPIGDQSGGPECVGARKDEHAVTRGFLEVFKYAVKFSDMELADTVEAFLTLRGKRLLGSSGVFRGVEVPEQLTDEEIEDLPFADLFFRFVPSTGYRQFDPQGYGGAKPPCRLPTATVAA